MPQAARKLMKPGENLLSICLTMHMAHTGSSDPIEYMEYIRLKHILVTSIQHWEAPHRKTKRFDYAVFGLIEITLTESAIYLEQ
jgi:hypothetical protein